MAMELMTRPCFVLIFLMASGLPVVTSVPDIFLPSRDDFSNPLGPADQTDAITEQDTSRLLQRHPQDVLSMLEAAVGNTDDGSSPSVIDIETADTEEMDELLRVIRQRVQEVERKKVMLLTRLGFRPGNKRGPTSNHFVRIGRSGASQDDTAIHDGLSLTHTRSRLSPKEAAIFRQLFQNPDSLKDPMLPTKGNEDDDVRTYADNNDNVDSKYTYDDAGYSTSSQNRDAAIGQEPSRENVSTGRPRHKIVNDFMFALMDTQTSAEHGEGERDTEDENSSHRQQPIPLQRRSYVRIGRLPASAFIQRIRQGQVVLPEDTLTARRSPGHRLSRTSFLRPGKRAV